jgi:hypothetical protein
MCRALWYFKGEHGVLKIAPRFPVAVDNPLYEYEGKEEHEKALT